MPNIYSRFQDTITTRVVGQKAYELTDQLGNVRATISDIKLPTGTPGSGPYKADFLSYMNPYPFGMPEPGRFWESKVYRYGYNGKERDDEIKGAGESYDYGFRMLDPRVGRFLSVDPLTAEYPWYSPYQFAGNMPTAMVDRDGLEPARPDAAYTQPTETGGDVSADQGSVEQSQRTVKSDVSRVTPTSMRALAIQQSRESIAPATPVEDDRSFGSGVWTGVLGFFVKTGLTFTSPHGWDQIFSAPVTLARAGYQAASHPVLTYDAVSRAFAKFYNSSSYHKGEVFGEVLGAVGLVGATAGVVGLGAAAEVGGEIAPEAAQLTADLVPTVEAMQSVETVPIVSSEVSVVTDAAETAKQPFAMGLTDEGLEQFAAERGATTWKNLPDPVNWKTGVIEKLSDPETPIHFNLNGVNPWLGVSRAAAGRGGPTDWELLMIQQNPQWWKSIQFWENGIPAPNPFQQ